MKNFVINKILVSFFQNFDIRRKSSCRDYLELDLHAREILKNIITQELSMTPIDNLTFTTLACQSMLESGIEGDFVEVGIWRGGHLIAAHPYHHANRKIIGIDTFTGMTEPNSQEHNLRTLKKATIRNAELAQGKGWRPYSKIEVKDDMFRIYPNILESISLLEGDITQTEFQESIVLPESISILRVDVDWYQPTLATLEVFWDSVAIGGIVIFDDYGSWSGSRDAAKSFFRDRGLNPTFLPINEATRFIIKSL